VSELEGGEHTLPKGAIVIPADDEPIVLSEGGRLIVPFGIALEGKLVVQSRTSQKN
jgi:hypothetical protein